MQQERDSYKKHVLSSNKIKNPIFQLHNMFLRAAMKKYSRNMGAKPKGPGIVYCSAVILLLLCTCILRCILFCGENVLFSRFPSQIAHIFLGGSPWKEIV